MSVLFITHDLAVVGEIAVELEVVHRRGVPPTVNTAAWLVAVSVPLVKTARNFVPFWPDTTFGTVKVVVIAPATLLKVAPPSVLNCHCTVGDGAPDAAAVKIAVPPAFTVTSTGFSVITGPAVTVSVAAVVVAEPTVLVNTARNWLPF